MKKKSLKKVTSAVLVAAMSMGLLAGCGGSKSSGEAKTDADGATVIKFGIHVANPKKQETVTYNIVQGFNKENKGKYKVEFVAADTEAHSKNMKLAAQDGSLPEIVHLDSAEAPKYNEAEYLLDMSDFLKENKDIDDALDGMEDAFNDGKVQYGLPYQSNVQGFFYNKDLFDKAGIAYPTDDTTYDEFLDMIAKLKDSGVTPIAIGSKNSGYSMWEFNEFFSRYGWEDNEKSYTGDKAKYSNDDMNACFEKIKGLADAGAFPENMATIEYFDAKQLFNEGKAAMFHGYPALMQQLQTQMDAKLICIPYFSQTSEEAFVYMTPSLNIAFNKDLEKDQEKLETALDVLDCMISEEGQRLIANGRCVISLNTDVPTMMQDISGLEDEMKSNSIYIRYSAQKSFPASLEAIHGLLSGEMDEAQAYDAFRSAMNAEDTEEKAVVNFDREYSIALNDKNGRDAASSILTTVRVENNAQLAIAPYYYFTASIYKGECTSSRVALMTAKSSDTSLYFAKINGEQVWKLVENYLDHTEDEFSITNKYELPILSGMKITVQKEEDGFSLKDITVDQEEIDKEKEYSILLTDTTRSILEKTTPGCRIKQLPDMTLSSAWTAFMEKGQQPLAPEDYIEVKK